MNIFFCCIQWVGLFEVHGFERMTELKLKEVFCTFVLGNGRHDVVKRIPQCHCECIILFTITFLLMAYAHTHTSQSDAIYFTYTPHECEV